jgi:DnaJ-domain-containing protein 1
MDRRGCTQVQQHICGIEHLVQFCQAGAAYTLKVDARGVDQPLEIFGDDEPADQAYHFCQEYGLPDSALNNILHHLCDEEEGQMVAMCSRKKPKTKTLFRLYLSTATVKDYEVAVSDVDTPPDVAKRIRERFCPEGLPVGSDTCNMQKMEKMVQAKLDSHKAKQQEKLFAEENGDLFAILGIDEHADQRELKKAYRQQSLKYHPDKQQGDEASRKAAQAKFIKVAHAFETLSDPQKRAGYMAQRNAGNQQPLPENMQMMQHAIRLFNGVFQVQAGTTIQMGGFNIVCGAGGTMNINGMQFQGM